MNTDSDGKATGNRYADDLTGNKIRYRKREGMAFQGACLRPRCRDLTSCNDAVHVAVV